MGKKLNLDFSNTEIAFAHKSNTELKKTSFLFEMMNMAPLVDIGGKIGALAVKLRIPFSETIVRNTIYPQFCGGETLEKCIPSIEKLSKSKILTILDYGAEGKESHEDFEIVKKETLRAIDFAAKDQNIPVVSMKITGMVRSEILEKLHAKEALNKEEKKEYDQLYQRVFAICKSASEKNVALFVDAEESWMQDPMDEIVLDMMEKFNKEKATVYNTYQMYLHAKLDHLKRDHKRCKEKGVFLGAKLVRGAYMEKEQKRAKELGYLDPVQPKKDATDFDFNQAIRYCIDNIEDIYSCCASHNADSNLLQAQLIHEKGLSHDHPHVNFAQLYGMSDNITYNLASQNYNSSKYVVYGPIRDVIPYLIRRTQENKSITGDMSRELKLIKTEIKRREI